MNTQQIQILLALLTTVISLSIAIAPQPMFPRPELVDTVNEETNAENTDVRDTLDVIERETLGEITEHQLSIDNRQFTPRKCCKIGKKVVDKGMYCNIDLMQVQKKNNGVYRRKMKFHGTDSLAVDQTYKTLMMRVEKCYPSKASRSMFTKCCEWQLQIVTDLDNCKFLETRDERRECKQRVRGRE